jgi:hypothetical protein
MTEAVAAAAGRVRDEHPWDAAKPTAATSAAEERP